jgi:hypothetical protein
VVADLVHVVAENGTRVTTRERHAGFAPFDAPSPTDSGARGHAGSFVRASDARPDARRPGRRTSHIVIRRVALVM